MHLLAMYMLRMKMIGMLKTKLLHLLTLNRKDFSGKPLTIFMLILTVLRLLSDAFVLNEVDFYFIFLLSLLMFYCMFMY